VFVCAIFLGCITATHLRAADAPAEKQVKSAWQYNIFDYPADGPTLDSNLNGLAKSGWEIISVSKYVDPNQGLLACVAARIKIVPGTNSYQSGN